MSLKLLTLREADERLGLKTGTLASWFYFKRLPDDVCGFVGTSRRRRVIPEENLERIAELVKQWKGG
jgi:hypothetical protein